MNLPATVIEIDHCRKLATVLRLTEDMIRLADDGAWEKVAELEVERRDDLTECFSYPVGAYDSQLISEAIAALLHMNDVLMTKLQVARESVLQAGKKASEAKTAVLAYHNVDKDS